LPSKVRRLERNTLTFAQLDAMYAPRRRLFMDLPSGSADANRRGLLHRGGADRLDATRGVRAQVLHAQLHLLNAYSSPTYHPALSPQTPKIMISHRRSRILVHYVMLISRTSSLGATSSLTTFNPRVVPRLAHIFNFSWDLLVKIRKMTLQMT
jgi:hypothetical protein